MTGLIIIMSQSPDGITTGAKLTALSFNTLLNSEVGGVITAIALAVFAYSTLLGWSYYGEIAMEYMFGMSVIKYYRIVFVLFILFGSLIRLETVWTFTDVMNALMALPNLIALVFLWKEIKRIHNDYFTSNTITERIYQIN